MDARMSCKCSGLWKIVVVMVLVYIYTLLIVHSSLQLSQVEFSVGISRRGSISEEADEISGLLRERKIKVQYGDNHEQEAVPSFWKRKWWRNFFISNTESNMTSHEEWNALVKQSKTFNNFEDTNVQSTAKRRKKRHYLSNANLPVECRHKNLTEFEFLQADSSVDIFSAYLNTRPNDFDNPRYRTFIRMIAVIQIRTRPSLVCKFSVNEDIRQSNVTYYEMCENHKRPYGGFILSCLVPVDLTSPICSVVVAVKDEERAVEVRVRTLKPVARRRKFTICVPPLFGRVNIQHLVEFLGVSFRIDAEHVVLYISGWEPDLAKILHYYVEVRKQASVIP